MPGLWLPLASSTGTTSGTATVSTFELTDADGNPVLAAPGSGGASTNSAVYHPGTDRTYLAYLGEGRDCYILAYQHATGTMIGPEFVGIYPLPDDDNHGNPTVAVDHDGHIHIVWGSHGRGDVSLAAEHRHSRSDNPHDITAWTTTAIGEGTYAHLAVAANGDLLLFDRIDNDHNSTFPAHEYGALRVSTNGTTFGSASAVIDTTGTPEALSDAYLIAATMEDDGLVHLSWTVARGATHDSTRTNLYHATYDHTTGTLAAMDGTDLGATIDWTEHASVLAATGTNVQQIKHLMVGDKVHIAYTVGTFTTVPEGTFETYVATWDGAAWSTVATGAESPWGYGIGGLAPYGDGLIGMFTSRTGTYSDITAWISPDGATWQQAGTFLEGSSGEGFGRVQPIYDGPWMAYAQEMPTDWAATSATSSDLLPLHIIKRAGLHDPDQFAAVDHDHDGTYSPVAHTHEGTEHREVAMVGSGASLEPVTNTDEDDWLYGVFT